MRLLRIILFPLALLYGVIVYLRNLLYDKEIFKSTRFDTPTICVGNIALGGTGKTPMIELLIKYYVAKGKKVVVLSRGYGRATKGLIHAEPTSSPADIGDEPKQLLEAFPMIDIVVCADRVHAMQYVEKKIKPDLVLLDDAFQHRRIKATIALVLTTFNNPFFNDYYLPYGQLRDHKISLNRADLFVVTKCPAVCSQDMKQTFKSHFKHKNSLYFATLNYAESCISEENSITVEDLKKYKINLVTGIANSKPLLAFLDKKEVSYTHFNFNDHHQYTQKDIASFNEQSSIVITTQKDYTKLKGRCDSLYYLRVEHQIQDQEHFFEVIDQNLWV